MRGLETLLQLLSADRDSYFLPAVKIQDQPRFRWRGLLIDIGRHYEPPKC
jgi:hexosaminidase